MATQDERKPEEAKPAIPVDEDGEFAEPSAVTTSTPEPTKEPEARAPEPTKPAHPRGLVIKAKRLGANDDYINSLSTDELYEQVEAEEERARQERERARPVKEEKEDEEVDVDSLAAELGLDKRVTKLLKAVPDLTKQNADLQSKIKAAEERDQKRRISEQEEVYDMAFASLPAKYKKVLGLGGVHEISQAEMKKRVRILKSAGIDPENDTPGSVKRKVIAAAQELLDDLIGDDEPPASKEAAQKEPVKQPEKKNGNPRISPEQWQAAELGTPSHRKSSEPTVKTDKDFELSVRKYYAEKGIPMDGGEDE